MTRPKKVPEELRIEEIKRGIWQADTGCDFEFLELDRFEALKGTELEIH